MTSAFFDFDGDGGDYGFEFALGTTSDLKLRASPALDVQKVTFELFARIDGPNGTDIPELPYQSKVQAATPTSPLTITWPVGSGLYAYMIRCQINDGQRPGVNGPEIVPEWTWEREAVYRLPSGQRPMCPSEQTQFDQYNGWPSAVNDMVGAWGAGTVVGPNPSTLDAVATYGNTTGSTLLNNPLVRVSQTTGRVLLGSNPPSQNGINLSNNQGLHWETVVPSAGSARVLAVDPSNNLQIGGTDADLSDVFIGAPAGKTVNARIGVTTKLIVGGAATNVVNRLEVGASPSSEAGINLTNGEGLYSKIGAGSLLLLGMNGVGNVFIGANDADINDVFLRGQSTTEFFFETGGVTKLTVNSSKVLVANELEVDGTLNHDGANLGFRGVAPVAISATYTPTNVTPDRSYNANSTTLDKLADVLGTVIADLQLQGLLG